MKKVLTLILSVFAIFSMNAQEKSITTMDFMPEKSFALSGASYASPTDLQIPNGDFVNGGNRSKSGAVNNWTIIKGTNYKEHTWSNLTDIAGYEAYGVQTWRGYTAPPQMKLSQVSKVSLPGVYEFRVLGQGHSDNDKYRGYYTIINDANTGLAVDTTFEKSELYFFMGANGVPDSVVFHSQFSDDLYKASWFSVCYVKETTGEEDFEYGIEGNRTLRDGMGPNTYMIGAARLFYCGDVDKYETDLNADLAKHIEEAEQIKARYKSSGNVKWLVAKLERYIADGKSSALSLSEKKNTIHRLEETIARIIKIEAFVSLNVDNINLNIGESFTLKATVYPEDTNNKTIVWKSSEPTVATVENGVVKALKVGRTIITAQVDGMIATCEVVVSDIPVYFWESPDGTPVEKGGKIEYMNGDGERLNYLNAGYYTICINGKKGNMNDAPAANSGYMLLTLDEALQAGDIINITAYRNKNADDRNATIQFYFENGAEWADSKSFVNICADENDEDYDDDGATPNTHTWEITEAEAGSKTIKLTRNSASTNIFITKLEIIRPPYEVSHVTLDKSVTTIEVGQSVTLTATVFPEKPNDVTVSWTTSNANVATVDNGVVKAVGVGTATIKAIAGGKTAECVVTVTPVYTAVSTTAEPSTSGLLKTLSVSELQNITALKISGTINSYDIIVLNNKMPKLQFLDLTDARFVASAHEYYEGYKTQDDVVGARMFTNQSKYIEIKLPETAKSIGGYAFSGCSSLISVTIPNSVTSIGSSAFSGCSSLTSVIIPNSVTSIGSSAFSGCSNLTSVTISNSVTSIANYTFRNCSSLTSVIIPNSVTSIGGEAFYGCSSLKSVTIPNSVISIGSSAFSGCSSLTSVIIPNSVTSIGGEAFYGCSSLTSVTIPSSVKTIGYAAFAGCEKLKEVYTRTVEPTDIDKNTFSSTTYSNANLYVPKTSFYLYWLDTEWCQFKNLAEYDAPYDNFYVNNDYVLDDETGNVQGTPDVDVEAGSGFIHEGSEDQNLDDVHMKDNGTTTGSIIGNGHIDATKLFFDIAVSKNKWYFFCFPYKAMLADMKHPGDYVWRKYDGNKRANSGGTGWADMTSDCLYQGEGYIYQTNVTGSLSVEILKEQFGKFEGKDINITLTAYNSSNANNASWNLIGNPFTSYYDINDMGYNAPITIWNGSSYVAIRPGDDDYILRPFEAFFVQKPNETSEIEFKAECRLTYNQSQVKMNKVAMKSPADSKRFVINLTISDGENSDKTRVVFNEKQNNAYEIGSDAAKFMSTESVPQLYTLDSKNVKYSINERPEGEVAMGYVANKEGQYTISAVRMDKAVMLKDLERGVIHDLSTGDYTFASEAGTFEGRFVLMLNSDVTGIDDIKSQTGVEVAVVNGGISISGAAGKTVTIYNVGGAQVAANVTDGVVALASGTYIVTVDGVSTKVVVK